MGSRASAGGGDAGEPRRVETDKLRRQNILGQQDGAVGQFSARLGFGFTQCGQNLALQIDKVGHAFGKAGILQSPQDRDLGFDRFAPGIARAFALCDLPRRCGGQFGIIEKAHMRGEDGRLCPTFPRRRAKFRPHRGKGILQAL